VICLSGDLGAGKTALTAGIAKGWGALEPVNSPTFVFVHDHRRAVDALRLYHVDCYRLNSDDDALTIGIEDILDGQAIVVIEWPERISSFLPAERLWIRLEALEDEQERRITLRAIGERFKRLVEKI
jgi:tRNA threonylcarbamoyladenosine biosynthesis protein TsaE